jgi:hypothetical protein
LADGPGGNGVDFAAMAEDLEIMGRILSKSIAANSQAIAGAALGTWVAPFVHLAPRIEVEDGDKSIQTVVLGEDGAELDSARALFSAYSSWASDLNVRGFYVPDSGALFTLEVMTRTSVVTETQDEDAPADLWADVERQVRRGDAQLAGVSKKLRKKAVLDPHAVDLVVESLLTAVAKHGAHIEQLAPPETVTVAVRLKPSRTALFGAVDDWAASVTCAPLRVVIQVPVEAIQAHADGTADLDEVKERSRITKY